MHTQSIDTSGSFQPNLTDGPGYRHPIDANGFRTFTEIKTGNAMKILATDEVAIRSLCDFRTPFATHTEAVFMRIDDESKPHSSLWSLLRFWK